MKKLLGIMAITLGTANIASAMSPISPLYRCKNKKIEAIIYPESAVVWIKGEDTMTSVHLKNRSHDPLEANKTLFDSDDLRSVLIFNRGLRIVPSVKFLINDGVLSLDIDENNNVGNAEQNILFKTTALCKKE